MSVFTLKIGEEGDEIEVKGRVTLGTMKKVQDKLKLKNSEDVFAKVQKIDIDVIAWMIFFAIQKYNSEITFDQILEGCSFDAFKILAESMHSSMGNETGA